MLFCNKLNAILKDLKVNNMSIIGNNFSYIKISTPRNKKKKLFDNVLTCEIMKYVIQTIYHFLSLKYIKPSYKSNGTKMH